MGVDLSRPQCSGSGSKHREQVVRQPYAVALDVFHAIACRRSEHFLTEPAPDPDELSELLRTASCAPDHGRLRPWRWVMVQGHGRERFGRALASDQSAGDESDALRKVLRAPLLAALVFTPRPSEKVPRWEQLASTSATAYALMLLLQARGYGSIWRTGKRCHSPAVRELLGVAEGEEFLGTLDIGTPPAAGAAKPTRPAWDPERHLSVLSDHG